MTNPYDKMARYIAKLNPDGFFRWLLREPAGLKFREWLDTRTIPFPGERDRVCDTVAGLDRTAANQPVACVTEFQSRRQTNILEREAEYALRLRRELRQGRGRGGRYEVIGALVNLTGRPQGDTLRMSVPEVPGAELCFRVVVRTLSTESAVATLAGIARGEIARCVLAWIPLMAGGAEDGIIDEWKRLASEEASDQWRADYAAAALVFAELTNGQDIWERSLEGWNMIQSKHLMKWQKEGEQRGSLLGARQALLRVVELRFPKAPARKFVRQVEATDDTEQLQRWFDRAVTSGNWDEFAQGLNGTKGA